MTLAPDKLETISTSRDPFSYEVNKGMCLEVNLQKYIQRPNLSRRKGLSIMSSYQYFS